MKYEILHEIGIKASAEAIYQALTELKKLNGWWTSDTRGSGSKKGDMLEFWFGEYCQKLQVTDLQPGKLVSWKAPGPDEDDEWAGTEITFKLSPEQDQCWLHFTHGGWSKNDGMLPSCSTKWAVFLLSLKDLLEKGKGQPFPNDTGINHS